MGRKKANWDKIVELTREGYSRQVVAKRLGISTATVRNALAANGIVFGHGGVRHGLYDSRGKRLMPGTPF